MSDAATLGIRSMDLGTTWPRRRLARDARAAWTFGHHDTDVLVRRRSRSREMEDGTHGDTMRSSVRESSRSTYVSRPPR